MLSSPAIIRRRVVLPEPEGPRKTTNSPARMSRLMSRITSTDPNLFETFSSAIPAIMNSATTLTIVSGLYLMSRLGIVATPTLPGHLAANRPEGMPGVRRGRA
jgi:hypothetical protein